MTVPTGARRVLHTESEVAVTWTPRRGGAQAQAELDCWRHAAALHGGGPADLPAVQAVLGHARSKRARVNRQRDSDSPKSGWPGGELRVAPPRAASGVGTDCIVC